MKKLKEDSSKAQILESIDTNQAWESFKRKVQQEPVPEFWSQQETNQANGIADPASLNTSIAPSEHLASSSPVFQQQPTKRSKSPLVSTRLRKWTAGVAAAAVAVTILFTPIGADALASLLHTFRLQHLETVSISREDMERLSQSLTKGSVNVENFDLNEYGHISQQGGGAIRTVTVAEANQLSGYQIKLLPGQSASSVSIEMQPANKLVFQLHTTPINKLIAHLGGKSKLPSSVDNQPITIEVPALVRISALNAKPAGETSRRLIQLQAPSVSVPDGVDVDKVRQAILDLPLLPAELRNKLASMEDWRHTLPIPAFEGNSMQTSVSGREAVLSKSGNGRMLIWLDNGRIYQLSGSSDDYPNDNAILADAKEIMKP